MEERKFVEMRKEEYGVKDFIKKEFGMGKVSRIRIEYTPVGERVIVSTHKPGLIIGKGGESIERLTRILKKKFKMENPHVDIAEIKKPEWDAQLMADDIALYLERFGPSRFKAIAYKTLARIKASGAKGTELVLSGKLPSDRARTWRFTFGYLKKTGDSANLVDRAEAVAQTKQGVVGIKVAVLSPEVKMKDQIDINEALLNELKKNAEAVEEVAEKKVKKVAKKKAVKKVKKGDKE